MINCQIKIDMGTNNVLFLNFVQNQVPDFFGDFKSIFFYTTEVAYLKLRMW